MTTREEAQRARDRAAKSAKAKPNGQGAAPLAYTLLSDLTPDLGSREIVKDLIPRLAFGELHAEAGAGKTAVLVDLLLHVAAGAEYRGRRVEQQPVIYVALEGHGGIGNRVVAARDHLEIEDDIPFALVKSRDHFRDEGAAQQVAQIARELMQRFGGDCPVIALDTYTAALGSGASDCDPKDVSEFIQNVQRHLLPVGTVILAHHFGKDASRGGRGWSGLNAALDFELELDREDDLRVMRVSKSRDGSDQQPGMCYRTAGRLLGENQYGEPVTAVVIEHLADENVGKRGRRYTPKARAALNVLWAMIKDRSRSFPIPELPGLRCVMLGAWEAECSQPGAISKAKIERERRRQFREGKSELEAAGAITTDSTDNRRVYPTPKEAAE